MRDSPILCNGRGDVSRYTYKHQDFGFERSFVNDWVQIQPAKGVRIAQQDESILDRLHAALRMLSLSIEVDPEIRSGVPVIKGTRYPISHLLAEIADDQTVSEIADAYDLDSDLIKKVLRGLSICLDRPFAAEQIPSLDIHNRAILRHDDDPVG